MPVGKERFTVESELFGWIRELRAGKSHERTQALVDLARAAVVPDASQPAEVWDALADAYAANGEPAKAGAADGARGRSGGRARARGRGGRLSAAGWRFPFSGRVIRRRRQGLVACGGRPVRGLPFAPRPPCSAAWRAAAPWRQGHRASPRRHTRRRSSSSSAIFQRILRPMKRAGFWANSRRRQRSPPGRNDLVGDRRRVAALARCAARHRPARS